MTDEVTFTPEQQALVDKLVGDARIKAREIATSEADAKRIKDEEAANRANLAAKQEWEKLAKTHEIRVKELEPLSDQVKAYQALIDGMLKDRIKELGDKAKGAVAGLPEAMSSLEKLDWLNKNTALFQDNSGAGVGTPNRPKDKPRDKLDPERISKFPIKL